jgi:cytochrome c-type biogenesis protein
VLEALFTSLTHAIEGAPAVALGAAVTWGVLSILLSPCHLSGIPLIVGYVSGQGPTNTRHAAGLSTVFAAGVMVTIAVLGLATAAVGRMAGDLGRAGNYAVAAVLLLVGLHLVGLLPAPWGGVGLGGISKQGYLGAAVLGLLFGTALGPCTFAYMAPVLAVTFRLSSTNAPYAAALLLAYGVGHCSVIVLAGASSGWVQRYLGSRGMARRSQAIRRVCGVLVLLGGAYLIRGVS